jgi:hypothetical protein
MIFKKQLKITNPNEIWGYLKIGRNMFGYMLNNENGLSPTWSSHTSVRWYIGFASLFFINFIRRRRNNMERRRKEEKRKRVVPQHQHRN